MAEQKKEYIRIRGANEHNLKAGRTDRTERIREIFLGL